MPLERSLRRKEELVLMLLFRRPTQEFIESTIEKNRVADFSYSHAGLTQSSSCPTGFTANRWSAVIAEGNEGFESAKRALQAHKKLQLGWLQHVGPCEPIEKESLVATLARESGLYSLNVARIVYVDDESPNRFAFGYGTLHEYPIMGEERFALTYDESSNQVAVEIYSFYRSNSWLTTMGRLFVRRAQQGFTEAPRKRCDSLVASDSHRRVIVIFDRSPASMVSLSFPQILLPHLIEIVVDLDVVVYTTVDCDVTEIG